MLEEFEGHMSEDVERSLKEMAESDVLRGEPNPNANAKYGAVLATDDSFHSVDEVRMRVLSKKKGCNKLFKDFFL